MILTHVQIIDELKRLSSGKRSKLKQKNWCQIKNKYVGKEDLTTAV